MNEVRTSWFNIKLLTQMGCSNCVQYAIFGETEYIEYTVGTQWAPNLAATLYLICIQMLQFDC